MKQVLETVMLASLDGLSKRDFLVVQIGPMRIVKAQLVF